MDVMTGSDDPSQMCAGPCRGGAEEYILLDSAEASAAASKHVRPATMLRTVSILETLSELVARAGGAVDTSAPTPEVVVTPGQGPPWKRQLRKLATGGVVPFKPILSVPAPPDADNHQRLRRKANKATPGGERCRCCRDTKELSTQVQTGECSGASALTSRTTRSTKGGWNQSGRKKQEAMLYTLRAKGRTPDWIAGIFSITRRGNLQRLSRVLEDMDATLIRNLSDHRGNNLLHVCSCYGHLECLQWLLRRGQQCQDAILDENKYELTPLVCAVKYGKLPCVEWLVTNTIARGQLTPTNGSRPLLHWAARYGQETILRWLTKYMEENSLDANVKDGHGNTALHLAAKHGHALSIKALMSSRCDVTIKNELGYKPSDYALLYGQAACSEYLMSMEACLILSNDVANSEHELSNAKTEMVEMKAQFKEVLSCSKKLVKEREELAQHLERLTDGLGKLSTRVMAQAQALSLDLGPNLSETDPPKERINGSSKVNGSQLLEDTVALCHSLHERCREGQQRWLSPSSIADFRQRVILAEDRWKRARARHDWGETDAERHMNIFRERLMQVQCWASGIRLSDVRSISSSESSLASMEDTTDEYEYEDYPNEAYWQSPPGAPCDCRHLSLEDPAKSQKTHLPTLGPVMCNSTPRKPTSHITKKPGNCSLLEILEPSSSDNEETKPRARSRKTKQRTRCLADNGPNWHSDQGPGSGGGPGGSNPGSGRAEESSAMQFSGACGKTVSPPSGTNVDEQSQRRQTTCPEAHVISRPIRGPPPDTDPSPKSGECSIPTNNDSGQPGKLMSSEPDLIMGMRLIPKPETSGETGVTNPSQVHLDPEDPNEAEDVLSDSVESRLLLPEYIVGGDGAECDTVSLQLNPLLHNNQHVVGVSNKKRGFLQKLSLRWPSKRKVVEKTGHHKKVQEITPEDFRETYMNTFRNGISCNYPDAETATPRQIQCAAADGEWDISKQIARLLPPDPGNILEPQQIGSEAETTANRTTPSEDDVVTSPLPEADAMTSHLEPCAMPTDIEFTGDKSRSASTNPDTSLHPKTDCENQSVECLSPPPATPSSSKAADSRPESSASLYRLPLSKTDLLLLPAMDSSTVSRMSPAPSEVSKTESTLSPPSDVSKTESLRHLRQLARIEESISIAAPQAVVFPHRKFVDVKRAAIVGIGGAGTAVIASTVTTVSPGEETRDQRKEVEEQKTEADQAITESSRAEGCKKERKGHQRTDKPWYEVSDDEEILMPETLNTSTVRNRSSSEEDELYCCA